MKRKQIKIPRVIVNSLPIDTVVVDGHVYESHKDISDEVLIGLVQQLDGTENDPDDEKPPFKYFVNLLHWNEKQYRLIWLLQENELFIGVVNAYRDNRKKKS